jgi:hypothetical protein
MNGFLFDKIQSVMDIQNKLEVHFFFYQNECDIEFEKSNSKNEELSVLLKEWFYEELKEKLEELDAYADTIHCTFKQQKKKLLAHLTLRCSDNDYEDNERHPKEEILNEVVLSILSIKIDNFDKEFLDFSFTYNVSFEHFEIYYAEEQFQLSQQEEEMIKLEIEKIISEWRGVFWGKKALEVEKFIEIDLSNYFHCYDIISYEFEFNCLKN